MNAAAKSAAVNSIAANADAVIVAALAANVGDTNVGRGAAALAVALAANATKVASLQIHSTCQFVCVWFGVFSCFGFVAYALANAANAGANAGTLLRTLLTVLAANAAANVANYMLMLLNAANAYALRPCRWCC